MTRDVTNQPSPNRDVTNQPSPNNDATPHDGNEDQRSSPRKNQQINQLLNIQAIKSSGSRNQTLVNKKNTHQPYKSPKERQFTAITQDKYPVFKQIIMEAPRFYKKYNMQLEEIKTNVLERSELITLIKKMSDDYSTESIKGIFNDYGISLINHPKLAVADLLDSSIYPLLSKSENERRLLYKKIFQEIISDDIESANLHFFLRYLSKKLGSEKLKQKLTKKNFSFFKTSSIESDHDTSLINQPKLVLQEPKLSLQNLLHSSIRPLLSEKDQSILHKKMLTQILQNSLDSNTSIAWLKYLMNKLNVEKLKEKLKKKNFSILKLTTIPRNFFSEDKKLYTLLSDDEKSTIDQERDKEILEKYQPVLTWIKDGIEAKSLEKAKLLLKLSAMIKEISINKAQELIEKEEIDFSQLNFLSVNTTDEFLKNRLILPFLKASKQLEIIEKQLTNMSSATRMRNNKRRSSLQELGIEYPDLLFILSKRDEDCAQSILKNPILSEQLSAEQIKILNEKYKDNNETEHINAPPHSRGNIV